MLSAEDQETIDNLQANWIWIDDWIDSSPLNTAGRLVAFTRRFHLSAAPSLALIHCTADTRYKLFVNGKRVALGPARSSPLIWYYDSLDIAQHLERGDNEVKFVVMRWFVASRAAMPFERTAFPGLTVCGRVEAGETVVNLGSALEEWEAEVDESVLFPTGLVDDVFLHINERRDHEPRHEKATIKPYNMKTLNGDIAPWRLTPRCIPHPIESSVLVKTVRRCESSISEADWISFLSRTRHLHLAADSTHSLDLQAEVHSTAFLRWTFSVTTSSKLRLKVMYSEGYEQLDPTRAYPFFRTKRDRLDASNGHIIGPFDDVTLSIEPGETTTWEPFWFRTFRLLRVEMTVLEGVVELESFTATQVNYPLDVKAAWKEPRNEDAEKIWDVSIRTMRNCMFDGYSDCPFYEQLQYSGDSRSVGLFHYLLSGDDRLMRQTITNFAASVTPSGLTQSRFPSHVKQVIAGFPLYWILQVCDHHLFFGDSGYSRSFLPRIDGVLEFFHEHIDDRGLVSGFPDEVWSYVDWVTNWASTDTHPDKGVPTSGRASKRHTFFSLLYGHVLKQAASLVRAVGRPGYAEEYETRAAAVLQAVRTHCYDGSFFTDSTADIAGDDAYSQHCQVFAILSGAANDPADHARLLRESFSNPRFSKCSYVMMLYALRAFALAGDDMYASYWPRARAPFVQMIRNNLSTMEEDDVRQRSDCHAWSAVMIYEHCTEIAGIRPLEPGCAKVLFSPRVGLSEEVDAKVALGAGNVASVRWKRNGEGRKRVEVRFERSVELVTRMPGGERVERGRVDSWEAIV